MRSMRQHSATTKHLGKMTGNQCPAAQLCGLPWRLELFFKDRDDLERQMTFLKEHGVTRVNITNKSHGDDLLKTAEKLQQALPDIDICVHYSLKYNYEKTPDATFSRLQSFLSGLQQQAGMYEEAAAAAAAAQASRHHVLLVSGGGKKKRFDTVAALQQLSTTHCSRPQPPHASGPACKRARVTLAASPVKQGGATTSKELATQPRSNRYAPATGSPQLAVAFNPYLPDQPEAATEHDRLRAKLETGLVSRVYLQMGSDIDKLKIGVAHAKALFEELYTQAGKQQPQLLGSIFLPSKRLLAQMKFRPWNGVYLSQEYLSSVEAADAITRDILHTYAAAGVVPLVESAVKSDKELSSLLQLLSSTCATQQ